MPPQRTVARLQQRRGAAWQCCKCALRTANLAFENQGAAHTRKAAQREAGRRWESEGVGGLGACEVAIAGLGRVSCSSCPDRAD